jgi:hypothetical protein
VNRERHQGRGDDRLIEDQQVGFEDEGGSKLDPLLVAQAQALELVLGARGETEAIEPGAGGLKGSTIRITPPSDTRESDRRGRHFVRPPVG